MVVCPKCKNAGFIIFKSIDAACGVDTKDCPLKCEAQQKLRDSINKKKTRENKMEEQKYETTVMKFFSYEHLPETLRSVSKPFCDLAKYVDQTLPKNAESTTALRKLLEAKDCAVRSVL